MTLSKKKAFTYWLVTQHVAVIELWSTLYLIAHDNVLIKKIGWKIKAGERDEGVPEFFKKRTPCTVLSDQH